MTAGDRIRTGLLALGVPNPSRVAEKLLAYAELVLDWNKRTNLVGAKGLDELAVSHFLDSLAPVVGLPLRNPVMDIGSGAGLPGIVVAAAYPERNVILLEPRAKRAQFLKHAIQELGLENAVVEPVRAETAARSRWRETAGTVLIRAVAKPRVAMEYGLPLLRKGGRLALYIGRRGEPERDELAVLKLLGGAFEEARVVKVPYLQAARHVWIIRKAGVTPAGYPRRSGVPERRPLCPEEGFPWNVP